MNPLSSRRCRHRPAISRKCLATGRHLGRLARGPEITVGKSWKHAPRPSAALPCRTVERHVKRAVFRNRAAKLEFRGVPRCRDLAPFNIGLEETELHPVSPGNVRG